MKGMTRRTLAASVCTVSLLLACMMGPCADGLQSRRVWADSREPWDAIYLVAGARAQDRRIKALSGWMANASTHSASGSVRVLIGNDPQAARYCTRHGTNHSRTEWAQEILATELASAHAALPAEVVTGTFSSTEGEMQALRDYLQRHPDVKRIAMVTCRFHARRLLGSARRHNPCESLAFGIVPALPCWEDRAPWIVLGEYVKRLRDVAGISGVPGLTRGPSQ